MSGKEMNNTNVVSEDVKKVLLDATAKITSGYFSNNRVEEEHIQDVIEKVYAGLVSTMEKSTSYTLKPVINPKDSVHPDYIVCLEDGKKLKMLRRYIKTKFGMSEAEYKEKWGLSRDYPMIAPNYAKRRSVIAKKTGLGKK